ncbi:uncharacterized protein LOC107045524 [Diachasma alloeum]|uniref:uncharacterized protein LOC107045524 n=1 Tax=Diachasma alloeum TaxID=454923 RepID=UPI00073826B2|nr:uncharacterized protein LOC107045524 [Diachasma alloeum]
MQLPATLNEDLNWWLHNIDSLGNPINDFKYELEVHSDASRSGWGAFAEEQRAHGFWNLEEQGHHINYLELLSAFLALKCFAKDLQNCNILLRIDNTTAISYINRMGGIQILNLSKLAKEIWQWCERRNLWIFASYISSTDNSIADYESRRLEPETEFSLAPYAFEEICRSFGCPKIDLFASRSNTKCKRFVSWQNDLESVAIDAFMETTPTPEATYPGGRSIVRKAMEMRGIPPESSELSMDSIHLSSWKQYDSPLKKWWQFCLNNQIDVYTLNITRILSFLTEQFHKGASQGTINYYRSALSLLLGPEVGSDPNIKRFCKGVSNKRPSKPKYNDTWDPKVVLDLLETWPSNEALSLKLLTLKLTILLALTTSHRMQTLSVIDIRNVRVLVDSIEIKIPATIKTSGTSASSNKKRPTLILPFFTQNKRICVATTLRDYLQATQDLRINTSNLLISYKKPHNKVTAQTISRWIKEILKECGIDTEIFTAYSTRHASTSAAKRSGISVDLIKQTAGWTKKSKAFANFYHLELTEDKTKYAKALLSRTNE